MNGALRNLYACHGNYGNYPSTTGRTQHLQVRKEHRTDRAVAGLLRNNVSNEFPLLT